MGINLTECFNDLPDGVNFPNGMVAIDTETLGLKIHRDRLCLCQVGDGEGNVWLIKFDGKNYNAPNLKKVLEDKNLLKLFHFARFDIAVIDKYLGSLAHPVYCTKIASKLTRTYTERHGLKILVEELLGESISKAEQQTNWASEKLTEAQKHYAASDVIYLHSLKKILDKNLKSRGLTNFAEHCFTFLPIRAQLDLAGWEETDIFAHN